MATIVPMTPTPTRAGKGALGGAVGRGLADVVGQLAEQKRQREFSQAIQTAIKESKDINEFVGKTAQFARNPQEVQQLYEIGAKAYPEKEPIEQVLLEGFDVESGRKRSIAHAKGQPPTEAERKAKGFTVSPPLREPEQFYHPRTFKPVGKKSGIRPEIGGQSALTFKEMKLERESRAAARKAGAEAGGLKSDMMRRARATIRAKNAVLPAKLQRPINPRSIDHAVKYEQSMRQGTDIINAHFGEKLGESFTFGNKAPQQARAVELLDSALWQRPADAAAAAQEAIRQAEHEIKIEDVGAGLQQPEPEEDRSLGGVLSRLFGIEEEEKGIPEDFQIPPEVAAGSDRDVAKFLAQEFAEDPEKPTPEEMEQIRAWLKTDR